MIKQRMCLSCNKMFESKGNFNRVCAKCKKHNERSDDGKMPIYSFVFPESDELLLHENQ